MCASISPGIRVRSPRSITSAPTGCLTDVPTSTMRSPCTSTSPGLIMRPVLTSSSRAECSTIGRAAAGSDCPAAAVVRYSNDNSATDEKTRIRRVISPAMVPPCNPRYQTVMLAVSIMPFSASAANPSRSQRLKALNVRENGTPKHSRMTPPGDPNHKPSWDGSHPNSLSPRETESTYERLRSPHKSQARPDRHGTFHGLSGNRLSRIRLSQAGRSLRRFRCSVEPSPDPDLLHGRIHSRLAGLHFPVRPRALLFHTLLRQRQLRPAAHSFRRRRSPCRPIFAHNHADVRRHSRRLDFPFLLPPRRRTRLRAVRVVRARRGAGTPACVSL